MNLMKIWSMAKTDIKETCSKKAYRLLFVGPFIFVAFFGVLGLLMFEAIPNQVEIIYEPEFKSEAMLIKNALELEGTAPFGHSKFQVLLRQTEADHLTLSQQIRRGELLGFIEITENHSQNGALFSVFIEVDSGKAIYERMLTAVSILNSCPEVKHTNSLLPAENLQANLPIRNNNQSESTFQKLLIILFIMAAQFAIQTSTTPLLAAIAEEKGKGGMDVLLMAVTTLEFVMSKYLAVIITGGALVAWLFAILSTLGFCFQLIQLEQILSFVIFGLVGLIFQTGLFFTFSTVAKDSRHATTISNPYIFLNTLLGMLVFLVIGQPDSTIATYLTRFPMTIYFVAPLQFTLSGSASYGNLGISFAIITSCIAVNLWINIKLFTLQNISSATMPSFREFLQNFLRWQS